MSPDIQRVFCYYITTYMFLCAASISLSAIATESLTDSGDVTSQLLESITNSINAFNSFTKASS